MIIFLYGKEKFLLFRRYLELKDNFSQKNDQAKVFEFDGGENFDLDDFRGAISGGAGLFAEKKMVIVKDLFFLPASVQKNFPELIESGGVVDDAELFLFVVEQHSNPTKSKLFDFLKKNSKAQEFKPLVGGELEKWIRVEVTKKSGGDARIDDAAVKKIAALSGGDLWALQGLIANLAGYCDGAIKPDDVDLFGGEKFADKIFDLVDALGSRNISKALNIKHRLVAQGENEFLIFSMIVSQIRNLLKVNEGMKRGMQPISIANSLGMHPFVVKKTVSQLQNYGERKLKDAFQLASKLDLETKTGEMEMKDALDYFIVKM